MYPFIFIFSAILTSFARNSIFKRFLREERSIYEDERVVLCKNINTIEYWRNYNGGRRPLEHFLWGRIVLEVKLNRLWSNNNTMASDTYVPTITLMLQFWKPFI